MQTRRANAATISAAIAEYAHDKGYEPHSTGSWSFRKDLCDDLESAGQDKLASRTLLHRNIYNASKELVYKKDNSGKDIGECASGSGMLPLTDENSAAHWRVPNSRVKCVAHIPKDSEAWRVNILESAVLLTSKAA